MLLASFFLPSDCSAQPVAPSSAATISSSPPEVTKAEENWPAYRLRLFWGGGEPAAWSGKLSVDKGQLAQLRLLDANYDAPANAHLEAGAVEIHQRRRHRQSGLDITVNAPSESVLKLELRDPQTDKLATFDIPVQQVLQTAFRRSLGEGQASVLVHRATADRLRVKAGRDDLLLAPGESLPLDIEVALPELTAGKPVDVAVSLSPARQQNRLWSSNAQRLSAPVEGFATTQVAVPMPAEEGVYTVRIVARQPPGSVKAWLPRSEGTLLAQRDFQVVVYDSNRQPLVPSDWKTLQEIDPTNKRWWDRLPKWVWLRRAPWLPKGPLGSSPAEIISLPANPSNSEKSNAGRVVRLPAAEPTAPVWQAYPMPIIEPGKPYLVEVEYPADAQQQLVVTIMDQDRQGVAAPLGGSTGVAVTAWDTKPGEMRVLRRMFWSKSSSPLLVISNHDPARVARYGRIRVLQAGGQRVARRPARDGRKLLAHIETPHLPRAVGATFAPLPEHEDWQTCYETASRLADWVALSGQDGAVVTVASAAGTIYPSQFFGDQPGLDRQLLASGMLDLPRKDALELLLREFDRRGLSLTPAVRFESLLPRIEATRWGDDNPLRRGAYSPLEEQTQAAMVQAVAELRDRYANHRSFAGVAIQLTSTDYAALHREPGEADSWTNPEVIDQFLAENRLELSPAAGASRSVAFGKAVRGPWRDAWRIWSSGRMTQLARRLAQAAGAGEANRRLLILPSRALLTGAAARTLRPQLDVEPDGRASLLALGLDWEQLASETGVTVVLPRYLTGQQALASEATRLQANESFQRLSNLRGVMLVGSQQDSRLTSLESANPFGGKRTSAALTILSHSSALLESHAQVAAEGAPRVVLTSTASAPLVLDDRLHDARQSLRQLPSATISGKTASQQPFEVKAIESATGVILQLSNPSPWPVEASITIRTPTACSVREVKVGTAPQSQADSLQAGAVQYGKGEHVIRAPLAAYDFKLLEFDEPGVEPLGVRAHVIGDARSQLDARLDDLRNRNLSAPSRFTANLNPSFEEVAFDGAVASWQALAGPERGAVSLATSDVEQGERALRITSRGSSVGVQSQPFAAPATGQLAMVFRIRGENLADDSRLRIVFEQPSGEYRNHTLIDAARINSAAGAWRPYVFSVDDLPIGQTSDRNTGQPTGQMRIRFELIGEGQVDLDHLELYDLVFPLEFLAGESAKQKLALLKTIHAAENALEAGRLNDCRAMLDGYWPRFVQSYTPRVQIATTPQAQPAPKVAAVPTPKEKPPAKEDTEEPTEEKDTPGFGERMKGYLPGFLRF